MSILDELSRNIVEFTISKDKKTVEIAEACDGYFKTDLSKSRFGKLIDELQEIHAKMVEL